MLTPSEIGDGRWWRFDAYEVRDGKICPKHGAKLEIFYPWSEYHEARKGRQQVSSGKRIMEPPYQSLLDLCRQLRGQRYAPLASPDQETRTLLTNWCRRNGLLGVLPQSLFTIVLASRWGHLVKTEGPLFPVVEQHVRSSAAWTTGHFYYGLEATHRGESDFKDSDLVPEEYVSSKAPAPHVIVQEKLSDPKLERKPLKFIAHFFPGVKEWEAETFDYPRPLSEEFWKSYAEPIHNFLGPAFAFYDAVQIISRFKGTPIPELNQDDRAFYLEALRVTEALMANVRHTIGFTDDGQLMQRWTSPSLLASFGLMAFLDLTEGKVHRCANENCGRIFVTDAWQATYCSPRCRNTTLKRETRKRAKARQMRAEARQMRAEGEPFRHIAKRFGVDVKTVKAWMEKLA